MKVVFTLFISTICLFLQAQSDNGYRSFDLSSEVDLIIMPQQDNNALRQTELRSRKKGRADCFGKSLKTSINPVNSGTWDYTNSEIAIWRQKIISRNAKTLNLGFSRYQMPTSGKLYIHSKNYESMMGPFTRADNEEHNQLWTPVIKGDELTIEIQIPIDEVNELDILLEYVNHDFMDVLKASGSGSSGSCNVDVVCGAADGFPIIDEKRDIINSVGAYTLNGIEQCSGVLINNARNDCTPYFLTANHCEVNTSNAASVVVYWNYQNSECRQPETVASGREGDGTFSQFTSGSEFIAGYAPSDFTLLLLDDDISPEFSPYFAGWNVGRSLPDSSVCIHHPNIEEKRISLDYDPNVISIDFAEDTFIRVQSWDLGTTEKGSSGAPLFNNSDEVIGVLNSGQATCINNEFDDFGPMFLSWEGGGTPDTRLKDWLDPEGIGLTNLNGKNCTFVLQLEETVVEVCGENTNSKKVEFSVNDNFDGDVTISFNDLPTGLIIEIDNNKLAPGSTSSLLLDNIDALDPDVYQIELVADDGTNKVISNLVLKVFTSSAESVSVVRPENGNTGELTNLILEWSTDSEEVDLQLSEDENFSTISFEEQSIKDRVLSIEQLSPGTEYFWRLRATNICGVGDWSSAFSFTTGQIFCSNTLQNSETLEIPETQSDTITSSIDVNLSGVIRNIVVKNITGQHTWVGDLSMNLISPSGTVVNLIDFICDDADDFSIGFSGQQGEEEVPCPFTDMRLYRPNGNFEAFNGELAAGRWRLQIVDIATLDGGELNRWSIEVCTEISTEAIMYVGNKKISTCGASTASSLLGLGLGFEGEVSLVVDAPDGIIARLAVEKVKNGGVSEVSFSGLQNVESGLYEVAITATDGTNSITEVIDLRVNNPLSEFDLISPINGEINTPIGPYLEWDQSGDEDSFLLQISTSSNFSTIIFATTVTNNSVTIDEDILEDLTEYYWRVTASNNCSSALSQTNSFTTEMGSSTFELDDLWFNIFPNPTSEFIKLRSDRPIARDIEVSIFGIDGKRVYNQRMLKGSNYLEVEVSSLTNGIYFVKIKDEIASHTEKIIISH